MIAPAIFIIMYAQNTIKIIIDQFHPATTIAIIEAIATARKTILSMKVFLSTFEPVPNFIANIGISLTRRRERMIASAGMNHEFDARHVIAESGFTAQQYAKDPQIIAAAGVGRPIKLSC